MNLLDEAYKAAYEAMRMQFEEDGYLLFGKQEKSMECSYKNELEDVKKVYEASLNELKTRLEYKLDGLVKFMKEFIEMHEAKKKFAVKLERLNAKLKCEEKDEGCCDDEDEDDDDC